MKMLIATVAVVSMSCSSSEPPASYGEGAELRYQALEEDECPPAPEQSPIDLPSSVCAEDLPDLHFDYVESDVVITNTGASIQYTYAPGSRLVIDGHAWELVQFHFHAHSEHAVGGSFAPMELHLVHRDADGKLLVVGVFLVKGRRNEALADALWNRLPREEGEVFEDADALFDASELLPGGATYRYTGSLTAPPCSGDVSWIVFARPIELSRGQLNRFTRLYPDNFRPLQPLDGRSVAFGQ